MAKTTKTLIPGILASLKTTHSKGGTPSKCSPAANEKQRLKGKPCKTKWQAKWLGLDVVHPKLQELADTAEAFCSRWFKNNPAKSLLVIVGTYGSGKTHVANAIRIFCSRAAFSAFETGRWGTTKVPQIIYASWPMLANEFNEKKFYVLAEMNHAELLVIDDIGAENDPWKVCADKLCQILSNRERKFTVITTNIEPAEWQARFDGRISDRLLRNSVVVNLTGVKSYAVI